MNHIIEVQHMEKENCFANVQKLNSDEYLDLNTGEIKEFEKTSNRSQGLNSLRKTFKKIRYLINNNFVGARNELHIVLTYAENMTDPKRLYDDLDKFMKRFRYDYRKESTIDYINIVEPQERGAWHCHLLVRFNNLNSVYLPNEYVRERWGHGYVTIQGLKDIDNIGAYLSAYLSDVEVNEEYTGPLEVEEKEINGQKKKFVKGGRLYMYPTGMNIFRKSRGCDYPVREKIKYKDIKKIVGSTKPHYQTVKKIENDDFTNTITYIQYNTKRTL